MEEFYKTIMGNSPSFITKFPDEESCRDWLFQYRWPGGFSCPYCKNNHYYLIIERKQYACKRCGKQVSLTAGTFLEKTRIPLQKSFYAVYLYNKNPEINTAEIARSLYLTKPTAWLLLKKIKKALTCREDRITLAKIVQFI